MVTTNHARAYECDERTEKTIDIIIIIILYYTYAFAPSIVCRGQGIKGCIVLGTKRW